MKDSSTAPLTLYKYSSLPLSIGSDDCSILPIALNNTHKAWSRKDVLDMADIHIAIGSIIHPDSNLDVEQLKEKVRGEILKLTASLPNTCYDDIPKPSDKTTEATAVKKDL